MVLVRGWSGYWQLNRLAKIDGIRERMVGLLAAIWVGWNKWYL